LKIFQVDSSFIKIRQEEQVLYMNTNVHFNHISLSTSQNDKCSRQKS